MLPTFVIEWRAEFQLVIIKLCVFPPLQIQIYGPSEVYPCTAKWFVNHRLRTAALEDGTCSKTRGVATVKGNGNSLNGDHPSAAMEMKTAD